MRWPTLIVAGALLLSMPALAVEAPRLLLGEDYPRAALEAIQGGRSTVDVACYFIILDPKAPDDPVAPLVEALVAAQRRGVQVTVVVEDAKAAENAEAVAGLRAGGVAVSRDSPARLLHAKALVVDERWVLVGSANWSRAAFSNNAEASVWLDDPPVAQSLAREIRRWAAEPRPASVPVSGEGVAIHLAWLAPDGVLSRMVEDRADAAFRVALALRRDGGLPSHPKAWQPYWREVGVTNARTQRKLRQRLAQYGVTEARGLSPQGTVPEPQGTVPLSTDFWTFGYARTLSPRAQFTYLMARAEALRSTRNPCWFRSQEDLAAATGLSDATLSLGFLELERENLVEIHRGDAPGDDFAGRLASHYCVNPLVNPADQTAAIAALGATYGDTTLRAARQMAASLNEPNDVVWIEALAQAMARHGPSVVRRAHRATLRRKPGSPGRTVAALLQQVN